MLYQDLRKRKEIVSEEIVKLQEQLNNYPDGNLICLRNGKYINYRLSKAGMYRYIKKREDKLINNLAEKKYISAVLQDLKKELDILNICLEKYSSMPSSVDSLMANPLYNKIIMKNIKPQSEDLYKWSMDSYTKSDIYPETLKFQCMSGHIVRSKSELLIDDALFKHRIPFRYENEIMLNDMILYPDFTIRHPITGEYMYWEHFGLMDSLNYINKLTQKMSIYCKNNIIPSVNLITTYETKEHPLTPKVIEDTICRFLL